MIYVITTVYTDLFSDRWFLDEIIPSLYALYDSMTEGYFLTQKILKTIHPLYISNQYNYIDSYVNDTYLNTQQVFVDNSYWNKYNNLRVFDFKNNSNWNHLNSHLEINLQSNSYWQSLYPQDCLSFSWLNISQSIFKVHFYDYGKSIYDVSFLESRIFKHHDYQVDLYYSTNFYWQPYISTNNTLTGLFMFWYEPYGAVEIGLKTFSSIWYQFQYPDIEEMFCLSQASGVSNSFYIYHDKPFGYKDYVMFLDLKKHKLKMLGIV